MRRWPAASLVLAALLVAIPRPGPVRSRELGSVLLLYGDPDLEILLHRPHRLTNGVPWGLIAAAEHIVGLVDG